MSRWLVTTVAVLFLSSSAFAQKQGDVRALMFTTNPAGGLGVSLAYWVGTQVSMELSTANERHSETRTVLFEGDQARVETFEYSSLPIDVLAQYHIATATVFRWKPYVGVGARFVKRPDESPDDRTNAVISPELNGGIYYHLTPQLAARIDVRQLLLGDVPPYDNSTKLSFGVAWRF